MIICYQNAKQTYQAYQAYQTYSYLILLSNLSPIRPTRLIPIMVQIDALFQPHIERLPSREPCRYFNSDCGLRNGIHLIMELD